MQTVLDALDVIRRGGDERQLSRALQWLGRELDRRFGARAEHFDVRQLVLVKVVRHAGSCRAAAPGAANRWLDTIYRRSSIDHARARAREPRLSRAGVLPEEEAPSEPLPEGLAEQMVDELFARLEEHLEVRIRRVHERAAASLRAELAWERHVEGRAPAALAEALSLRLAEPPKTDTLYKWIERGRERVWIPFLEGWAATDGPLDVVAGQALKVFLEARRKDVGAPPEVERASSSRGGVRARGGVRSRQDRTSVQYAEVEPEENHDA